MTTKKLTKRQRENQAEKIAQIKMDAFTLNEFCDAYCIDRVGLRALEKQGTAPPTFKFAGRLYISFVDAESWYEFWRKKHYDIGYWLKLIDDDCLRLEAWKRLRMEGGGT